MPSGTVDQLEIKIIDSSTQVNQSLKQMTSTLNKLKKASGANTSALTSFNNKLKDLNNNSNKTNKSLTNIITKLGISGYAFSKVGQALKSIVTSASGYIEDLNLFSVSLGDYAKEAKNYADEVRDVMGIDPADWLRSQAIFMTLATGFGVASDKAYLMSKNLAQLGYDISSFFNLSLEESMQKLQSGLAGELEPLRRIGYDLSVARLQQEAYKLGIDKTVMSMTQAEKAQLRYYAIMTQVTTVHGDMARTLEQPANQMRILTANINMAGRAVGNIFIPALNAILPVAIAVVQVITDIANAIASLFGFELIMPEYDTIDKIEGGTGGISDNLGDASNNAKKLKNNLLGIDELNIISKDLGSGGGIGDIGGGSGFEIELPEYDFLGDAINDRIKAIKDTIQDLLPLLGTLASAIGAFKLADLLSDLTKLSKLGFWQKLQFWASLITTIAGAFLYFKGAVDALSNGVDWLNLASMVGGLAIGVNGLYFALRPFVGSFMASVISLFTAGAGALGIFGISLRDIIQNGSNLQNTIGAISGLSIAVVALNKAMPKLSNLILSSNKEFKLFGKIIKKDVLANTTKLVPSIVGLGGSVSVLSLSLGDMALNGLNLANGLGALTGGFGSLASAINLAKTSATAFGATSIAGVLSGMGAVVVGLVGSLGALATKINDSAVAAYQASENYQRYQEQIKLASDITNTCNERIQVATERFNGMFNEIAKYETVRQLTDEIYALADKTDKSTSEIEELGFMVETLNGYGLEGVQIEFDETTGLIKANRDAINEAINSLESYAIKEALINASQQVWQDQIQNAIDLNSATKNLSSAQDEYNELVSDFLQEMATNGITKYSQDLLNQITTLNEKAIPALTEAKETSEKANKELQGQTKSIEEMWAVFNSTGVETFTKMLTNGANFSEEYSKIMSDVGANSTQALSDGINSGTQLVEQAMTNVVTSIGNAFGISTESTDGGNSWYQNGYNIDAQIGQAITENQHLVTEPITNMASSSNEAFSTVINEETYKGYANDITTSFGNEITKNLKPNKELFTDWATQSNTAFTDVANSEVWSGYGQNMVQGAINGVDSLASSLISRVRRLAQEVNSAFQVSLDINSPSGVFKKNAEYTIDGYIVGIEENQEKSVRVMKNWANSINEVSTKALSSDYEVEPISIDKYVGGNGFNSNEINNVSFKQALAEFYNEYMQPTMSSINDNTRIQAEKKESVQVQIGNQEVANAVKQQQKANGYSFVRG